MKSRLALLIILILFSSQALGIDTITINELFYNTSEKNANGQWLEIYNYGQKTINLKDWSLEKAGRDFSTFYIFPKIIIKPDSFIVVADKATNKANIQTTLDLFSGEKITAGIRIINAQGDTIDTILYGLNNVNNLTTNDKENYFNPTVPTGFSLCKKQNSKASSNQLYFSSPLPTPGQPNFSVTDLTEKIYESYVKDKNNEERLKLLQKILIKYDSFKRRDEILYWAFKALHLARKLGDITQQANTYNSLGLINLHFHEIKEAEKNYNKSLNIFRKLDLKTKVADSYNYLGIIEYNYNNYDSALVYFNKCINIKQKLGKEADCIPAYINIAKVYNKKNILKKEIKYLKKSLNLAILNDDKKQLMRIYNSLGNLYENIEDHKRSLRYFLEAIRFAELLHNKKYVAKISINIANNYFEIENYTNATDYYNKANKLFKSIDDSTNLARSTANIGNILVNQNNYQSALKYYFEALSLLRVRNNKLAAKIKANIGSVYIKLNNNEEAKTFLKKAYITADSNNYEDLKANILFYLGYIDYKENDYDNAKKHFLETLIFAKNSKNFLVEKNCYLKLAKIYADSKQYNLAYKYNIRYQTVKDSLSNIEQREKVTNYQLQKETSKLEEKISNLEQINKLKDLRTKNLRMQRYLFITIIVILILLASFVAYRFYFHKNLNEKLTEMVNQKTKNLQKINKNLREQIECSKRLEKQLKLSERLAGIGEIAAGLAHKIRNPLTIISSTAQFLKTGNIKKKEIENYSSRIIDSANDANSIIKSLLKFSNYKGPQKTSNDLRPILKSIIKTIKPTLKNYKIQLDYQIAQELKCIEFDVQKMEEIFSNLILNAIHSMKDTGGKLSIITEEFPDKITVSVIDTGSGISEKFLEKIFEPFFTLKEDGTGLGLSLAKKIVNSYDGKIEVFSKLNQGTKFRVIIPKPKG